MKKNVLEDRDCQSGYIAPDGSYYATLEPYSHIQIEDYLWKEGIIDCPKYQTRRYLEENGWCVLANSWVQFPSYNNEKWLGKPIREMTREQFKTLKLYSLRNLGSLMFGYNEPMSFARFETLYFGNKEKMTELFSVK